MELLQRFLLLGVATIVMRGTIAQLVLAEAVSLIYLVAQLQARPFAYVFDNFLAVANSISLVVLFFLCVILKVPTPYQPHSTTTSP